MAKRIKVIQCPQCGSTHSRRLKDDYYKCENCSAEYFLDNDDININVKHQFDTSSPQQANGISPIRVLGIILVVLVAMSFLVMKIFDGFKNSTESTLEIFADKFYDRDETNFPISLDGKNACIVTLSNRYYQSKLSNEDGRNGAYYSFVDPATNKIVKTDRLVGVDKIKEAKHRIFSDGRCLVVINKKKIIELDRVNKSFVDVSESLFQQDSVFASGVGTVEFLYERSGQGLKIMTNVGKEYYYFPLVNKSYTEKEYYKNSQNFSTLLPGARDSVYYAFTSKSITCRKELEQEDAVQLVKILFKYNAGGPEYTDHIPRWTDVNNNQIRLFYKDRERVVSFDNLTPGRLYFKPSIVYFDTNHLLIKYGVTAAQDTELNLQSIDVETGEVLWTVNINPKYDYSYFYSYTALIDGRYYIKTSSQNYIIIDEDGNNMEYYKLPSEF